MIHATEQQPIESLKCVLCGRRTHIEKIYQCRGLSIKYGLCQECRDDHEPLAVGVVENMIEVIRALIARKKFDAPNFERPDPKPRRPNQYLFSDEFLGPHVDKTGGR